MRWQSVVLYIGLAGVVTLLAIALEVAFFGTVSGVEFSPHALMRREFFYLVEPLTNIQLSPINRRPYQGMLEQQLVQAGWVSVQGPQRWDLVSGRYGHIEAGPQPAALLCDSLDMKTSQGELFWAGWNKQYPQQAARLWPIVFLLARHGWYELIPELLSTAQVSSNEPAEMFEEAIHRTVIDQVERLRPHLAENDKVTFTVVLEQLRAARQGKFGSQTHED